MFNINKIYFQIIFTSFFIHFHFSFTFKSHLLHFLFTVIFHSLSNHIHYYLISIFIFHSVLLNESSLYNFSFFSFSLFSFFITFLFLHNITVQLSKIATMTDNKSHSSSHSSEHADKQIFCLTSNASR